MMVLWYKLAGSQGHIMQRSLVLLKALQKAPQCSYLYNSPGTGFKLSLSGKDYNFALAERPPPEGYFAQDYVA